MAKKVSKATLVGRIDAIEADVLKAIDGLEGGEADSEPRDPKMPRELKMARIYLVQAMMWARRHVERSPN